MTRDPLVVGIDASTHGTKAIAWTLRGEPVAEGRAEVPILNPHTGWWEQDAEAWAVATRAALAQVGRQVGDRVAAVGLTQQRETFVGVDEQWRPVRPAILWMDERAHTEVVQLDSEFGGARFHEITGKPLSMTPSITKLLWLRAHERPAFEAARHWLDVGAYLGRDLVGEAVTAMPSAEPMGLVDLQAETWSEPLLEFTGIEPSRLPRLLPPGEVAGQLLPRVATEVGLRPGTPLVVSAGDGQTAAYGAQVFDLDRAYLNLGTAVVSGTVDSRYRVDRAFRTMAGAQRGTFLFESDLKGGTFTVDWLHGTLLGRSVALADLDRAAAALPPGAAGLVLVPYLGTVMDPYWDDNATGILVGIRGEHGPAHLLRAIMEGLAMEERLHLDGIGAATGRRIAAVHVLGGGSRSDLWCQILADALDRPVLRTRSQEATSLGAAMLAAVAAGFFPTAREAAEAMGGTGREFAPGPNAARYAALYHDVFADLYPTLRESLGRLAAFRHGDEVALPGD